MKKAKEEIEFKWSVSSTEQFSNFLKAAKSIGAALGSARTAVNRDLYLDTANHALEKNHITCRLRHSGGVFEFTVKSASKIKGGLARRAETNVPLPGVKDMAVALELVRSLFHHPAAAGGELDVAFQIENKRRHYALTLPRGFAAQACFDDVTIFAGLKTVGMREIELEYRTGSLPKFLDFTRQITKKAGLMPAKMSKVATARAALKYLH